MEALKNYGNFFDDIRFIILYFDKFFKQKEYNWERGIIYQFLQSLTAYEGRNCENAE